MKIHAEEPLSFLRPTQKHIGGYFESHYSVMSALSISVGSYLYTGRVLFS